MKITVPHYGLHELGSGVRFLFQKGGVTSAPGLELAGRLDVRLTDRFIECPHQIMPSEGGDPDLLPEHPLVEAFLPLPSQGRNKEPIYLEESPHSKAVVRELKRLASPSAHDRQYLLQVREKMRVYRETNLMPIVFSGFHWQWPQQPKKVEQWAETGTRRLVILLPKSLAKPLPGYMECDSLNLDELRWLDLEAIGARIVMDYLKHQEKGIWAS